jgi:hypothetical protein
MFPAQRQWGTPERVTIDGEVVSGDVVFRALQRPTLTLDFAALPTQGMPLDGYHCVVELGSRQYRFHATHKGAWQIPGRVTLTALEDVRPEPRELVAET